MIFKIGRRHMNSFWKRRPILVLRMRFRQIPAREFSRGLRMILLFHPNGMKSCDERAICTGNSLVSIRIHQWLKFLWGVHPIHFSAPKI